MRYKKIKDGDGDFGSFHPVRLHEELRSAIGEQGYPQKWYLNTNDIEIHVVILDKSIEIALVDAVVRHHFKTDWDLFKPVDKKTAIEMEINKITTIKDVKEILKKVL